MLTKPSKGVKNDGYDNEDSDYILYVNDILGSEEAGHKSDFPLIPLQSLTLKLWCTETVTSSLMSLVKVHSVRSSNARI